MVGNTPNYERYGPSYFIYKSFLLELPSNLLYWIVAESIQNCHYRYHNYVGELNPILEVDQKLEPESRAFD